MATHVSRIICLRLGLQEGWPEAVDKVIRPWVSPCLVAAVQAGAQLSRMESENCWLAATARVPPRSRVHVQLLRESQASLLSRVES
jgi:hypothetical protein